jgi:hypothetical protein
MIWSILWSAVQERLRLLGRSSRSFRGRDADAVESLVGGVSAYICNSSITDCVAIVARHDRFSPSLRIADAQLTR